MKKCSIIDLTKKLVRCPSISPKDEGCQDIIINYLKNIGFFIEKINIKDTKNFWAWHGSGKTLTFAGHTDIVPPGNVNQWLTNPFNPIVKNGFLFGRGVADMKGSLSAMLIASKNFILLYPKHEGRLSFLITSDEESTGKNGTKKVIQQLIKKKEHIDYCIVGEPTSENKIGDTIKHGRRGSMTAKLNIYGIQGHVAYPHLANNPIRQAVKFSNALLSKKWHQKNKFFPETNIEIIKFISDSKSDNMIPDTCFLQFNIRFGLEIKNKNIKKFVKSLLDKYNIQYSIEWIVVAQPFMTIPGTLSNAVVDSIKHFVGIEPKLKTDGGTSDGRFFPNIGAQVIELGPINHTIHKINECVKISDLRLLSKIYELIIKKILA